MAGSILLFCSSIPAAFFPAAAFADGLRDIKGPVYFPADYKLLLFALFIFLAGALFFLLRFASARLLKKTEEKKRKISPHEAAYKALEELRSKGYPLRGMAREHFFELSLIIKRYIGERYRLNVPEMTTEEFFRNIGDSGILSAAHKESLREFLDLCDIVKFAKYGPTREETDQSLEAAYRFIDETKTEDDDSPKTDEEKKMRNRRGV